MATPFVLLEALSQAFVLAETPGQDNEEFLAALSNLQAAQEELGWLVVRVEDEGLLAGGNAVQDPDGRLGPLGDALRASRIRELRFQKTLAPSFWRDFLEEVRTPNTEEGVESPSSRFRRFQADLGLSFTSATAEKNGVAGSVYQLFEQLVDSPSFARASGQLGKPSADHETAPESLPADLARDISLFRNEGGHTRSAARIRVLKEAGVLEDQRETETLADAVEFLCRDLQSLPDPQATLELAQELVSKGVANHLLARFASTRNDWERGDRLDLISRLGRTMAPVVADALVETRDRFQRRSLVEAMVALGSECLPVVERMLEDPQWFVVRNGVSILSEVGTEEQAPLLTAPLGHEDPRVRREAVLALGKLGGPEAGTLLQGMLDDPEAAVRTMACRALGALRIGRAVKPLMRLVEDEEDLDVRIDSLQALGRIGDPGAVPLIEKNATGGFFSRPQREIRVAAYRALASIGTPHAMSLVRKAARDTDREIRAIAQALLKKT